MDRDGLVAFVKRKLRIGTSGEALLSDAVIVTQVNEALRKFSRERMWPWLLTSATVSVGTDGTGTLPTGYIAARQLLHDGDVVAYVGLDELLMGSGRYVWTDDGAEVRVEPAPAASTDFTLWYYRREPELSGGTSTPLAPDLYHDAIGLWAAHLCAGIRRDDDLARDLGGEYGLEIDRMSKALTRKKGQTMRVALRSEVATTTAVW